MSLHKIIGLPRSSGFGPRKICAAHDGDGAVDGHFKSVDDGLFVSQFVGKDALAAVNLCFPLIIGVFGIAVMFATGGSALVARKIGEGKPEEAKRDFTSVIIISALISALITIPCVIFMEDIVRALGAKG